MAEWMFVVAIASAIAYDEDGDGWRSDLVFGGDCDDRDAGVHPRAPDAPDDGVDADCGGSDRRDRGLLRLVARRDRYRESAVSVYVGSELID